MNFFPDDCIDGKIPRYMFSGTFECADDESEVHFTGTFF